MAKVKLNKKFLDYTGTPPPNDSRFYLTNRYGKTIMSHYPMHKDPATITEKQHASTNLHTQATTIADAELRDPIKHDEWLHRWHEAITIGGQDYKTLRGYTIAQIRKQLSQ